MSNVLLLRLEDIRRQLKARQYQGALRGLNFLMEGIASHDKKLETKKFFTVAEVRNFMRDAYDLRTLSATAFEKYLSKEFEAYSKSPGKKSQEVELK